MTKKITNDRRLCEAAFPYYAARYITLMIANDGKENDDPAKDHVTPAFAEMFEGIYQDCLPSCPRKRYKLHQRVRGMCAIFQKACTNKNGQQRTITTPFVALSFWVMRLHKKSLWVDMQDGHFQELMDMYLEIIQSHDKNVDAINKCWRSGEKLAERIHEFMTAPKNGGYYKGECEHWLPQSKQDYSDLMQTMRTIRDQYIEKYKDGETAEKAVI